MRYRHSFIFVFLACLGLIIAPAALASGLEDKPAPAFELSDQYGDRHSLSDFSGQWLVVFFYPRANTPGCTTEACNFRDNIYAFRGLGAEVVGISTDPVDEQRAFSDEYRLPYAILSDADGAVGERYGVLTSRGDVNFARRESFVIDPDGRIVRHYRDVDPETHSEQVLADLEELLQGAAS